MANVWSEIDKMKQESDKAQNEAKKAVEAFDGWKFKGWKSSAAHGVVWVAHSSRHRETVERANLSDLAPAVRARHEEILARERA